MTAQAGTWGTMKFDSGKWGVTPEAGEINFDLIEYVIVENAASVVITVTRSDGDYGVLKVDYSLQDESATATTDYEYQTGTLTFNDGETSKQIAINIVDDLTYEGDERFTISLSNLDKNHVGEGSIGSNDTALIIIEEDDAIPPAGEISFELDTESVNENDGSLTMNVNRTGGSFGEVSISYSSTDDTASAGADFTSVSDTLTFADGETTKTITIDLINDDNYESDETFTVQLSNLMGESTLGISKSVVTIFDDEPTPEAGVLEIEHASYSVSENTLSLSINILRTDGDFGEVSVDVATSNSTALAGEDYESTSETFTFADGEILKTITLIITDDSTYEGDETFNIQLSNIVGTELGNQSTSVIIIAEDDEVPPAGIIQFSGATYSVDENASTVLLTITRANGSYGSSSVDVSTIVGAALDGEDYWFITETVMFFDGDTSKTITITILDDNVYEGDESFNVVLSNLVGEATLGNPSTAIVTIIENDEIPLAGILQFSGESYSVNERAGSVTITVQRIDGSYGDVSVDYSVTDGDAINGSDYSVSDGTLYFIDGEMSKTIIIDIIDDALDEVTETLIVNLSNPINAVLGNNQTASVSILDNDNPPSSDYDSKSSGGGGSFGYWLILLATAIRLRKSTRLKLAA